MSFRQGQKFPVQVSDGGVESGFITTVVYHVISQRQSLGPTRLLGQHASGQRFIDTVA